MSGIYASLRQAQIITLEILQCMDACPAEFKRGGYNFCLPPLKVRDLRQVFLALGFIEILTS